MVSPGQGHRSLPMVWYDIECWARNPSAGVPHSSVVLCIRVVASTLEPPDAAELLLDEAFVFRGPNDDCHFKSPPHPNRHGGG